MIFNLLSRFWIAVIKSLRRSLSVGRLSCALVLDSHPEAPSRDAYQSEVVLSGQDRR